MSDIVIRIENLAKQYRLGQVGTGTLAHDLNRWWHRIRGKEDPYLKIGETNEQTRRGEIDYVWALRDINLEIKQGERIGIIGSNGAGKSTLLKILSKVTGPTIGQIKIKGRIASLLEIGTGFHQEMTGRENVYLNGAILGMTRREIHRDLDAIVDFAGVARYFDTPVKRYSSGMLVRLGFAVAAHLKPDILVVDEVLAVGDAEFQKRAIGKMQEVSEDQGRTIIFVSHNMAAIKKLCQSAILIREGMIANQGTAVDVVTDYLIDKAHNVFDADLRERDERAGNGSARMTRIRIVDQESDEVANGVRTGQDIAIEVDYCTCSNESPSDLIIGLAIFSSDGNLVTICNSHLSSGVHFGDVPHQGTVRCRIDQLPLMPGHYHIRASISLNGALTDQVNDAINFAVDPDVIGNGQEIPMHHRHGIYINHSWALSRQSRAA